MLFVREEVLIHPGYLRRHPEQLLRAGMIFENGLKSFQYTLQSVKIIKYSRNT